MVNPTTINAVTPAGTAGARDVAVTTVGGTGTGVGLYTYALTPAITSITPNRGPTRGGTPVTITGSGFNGATAVRFGTLIASFTVVNDTTITAVTPPNVAGPSTVTVSGPGGTSVVTVTFDYADIVVPTMSTAALALLALVLAVFAAGRLRVRRLR